MVKPHIHSKLSRFAQSSPFIWKICWEAVHHARFLLPHDSSYLALRHFIGEKRAGLFLDVGANDGISALSFRRICTTFNIFSIEPNLSLQPRLLSIAQRDCLFAFQMLAIGNASGEIELLVPIYRGVHLHTFSSVSKDSILSSITDVYGSRVAASIKFVVFRVQLRTIDSFLLNPDIIKVDVEGRESDVLSGAAQTLRRARPHIMFEVAPDSIEGIRTLLHSLDYVMMSYDPGVDHFTVISFPKSAEYPRNLFASPQEAIASLPGV